MKRLIVAAGILIMAGTAHAQHGGSINNGGTINGSGNINNTGGINNSQSSSSGDSSKITERPSSPGASTDISVNRNSKNPGEFVPSTFSSYQDAVTLGILEGQIRPLSVAEAARLSRQQKTAASQKPGIVLEQDPSGKLVIAQERK
jgi:hypothetical protein